MQILTKHYTAENFLQEYEILKSNRRILNAGSSSLRYGENCVNVDIQKKPNVDYVCDIHEIPDSLGQFDVIICNAALQYCAQPEKVAKQFYRILKPGGYLFIDAPWVQPFCPDTPDRFRFSQDALKQIFSDFEIVKVGPSITSGSAFAMLGVHIAMNSTRNKYINFILAKLMEFVLYPFKFLSTANEARTAGAFYLIGQKSISAG